MKKRLEITTNVGCKNLCEYCPQDINIKAYKKISSERFLKLDIFKNCINKVPKTVDIYFAGSSEPFLNPQAFEMVKYAVEKGHATYLYTTLIGITDSHIKNLSSLPLKKLVIHFPSSTKKENFFADSNYLGIASELINQVKNSSFITEYMCVGKVSKEIKHAFPDLNIRETQDEDMSDFGGNVRLEYVPHRHLTGKIYCSNDRIYWNVLYPNGDVALCCEDFGLDHILGNLILNEYDDLHQSEEFKKVISAMNSDFDNILCRNCEYARNIKPNVMKSFLKGLVAAPRKIEN